MRFRLLPCLLLLAACDRRPTGLATDSDDLLIPTKGMGGHSALSKAASPATAPTTEGTAIVGGIYQGLMPCADCAGIETVLYLYPDSTYLERQTYLNQPKAGEGGSAQLSSGRWTQVSANLVRLTRPTQPGPTDFRTHPHGLQQLDLDGQEIVGKLAERYHLARIGNF